MTDEFTDIVMINLGFSILFLFNSLFSIYTLNKEFNEYTNYKYKYKIRKKRVGIVLIGINILFILLYLLSIVFDSIYLATNKNILNINYIDIFILTLVEFVYNILIFFEYNIYYLEDLEDAIKTVTSYFL